MAQFYEQGGVACKVQRAVGGDGSFVHNMEPYEVEAKAASRV